jgi:DNA-binding transcriptional MerR regulator
MKDRTTIQIPKEIQKLLKDNKIHPREPYGDMMERTLKENEELKKKIKEMVKIK